jgi:hypothetical protein
MHKPKPGTIGLAKIGGALGAAIRFGQGMSGDLSMWTHAFVVVDDERVIEAQPGGARWASLDHYLQPGQAVFLVGWYELNDSQIAGLQHEANRLIGTPYSFLDYLSLAALGVGIKLPLTRKRIASSGHLICSQLADYLLAYVNVPLFDDGRLPMDVTPGDLHIRWTEAVSARAVNTGWPATLDVQTQDLGSAVHDLPITPIDHGLGE